VLPDMTGPQGQTVQLAIGAGKDGNIYLVNRANLGKFNPASNKAIYQELPNALVGGEWATSALFQRISLFRAGQQSPAAVHVRQGPAEGNADLAVADDLRLSRHDSQHIGRRQQRRDRLGGRGGPDGEAVLHAYNADDLADELYSSTIAGSRDAFGKQNKFITPVVTNGKVYVATTNGVGVFGLLPAAALPAGWSDADVGALKNQDWPASTAPPGRSPVAAPASGAGPTSSTSPVRQ